MLILIITELSNHCVPSANNISVFTSAEIWGMGGGKRWRGGGRGGGWKEASRRSVYLSYE